MSRKPAERTVRSAQQPTGSPSARPTAAGDASDALNRLVCVLHEIVAEVGTDAVIDAIRALAAMGRQRTSVDGVDAQRDHSPHKKTKTTPPQLARRWGISNDKVLAWIRSGELRAMDAGIRPGLGRPRYLIDEADIEKFELKRSNRPEPPKPRRRVEKLHGYFDHI